MKKYQNCCRSLHKNVKYKCVECERQFSNEENFRLHQKTTSHNGREIIEIVNEVIKPPEIITTTESSEITKEENLEMISTLDKTNIETTETNIEEPPANESSSVEIPVENNPLLEKSEEITTQEKTDFPCSHCSQSFPLEEDLEAHIKTDHNEEKLSSPVFILSFEFFI